MSRSTSDVSSWRSFVTYVSHFYEYCFVLRVILGAQLSFILVCGLGFAVVESIPLLQGIYFALITSTTVGYGDITPETGVGQAVSVVLAVHGTILFGLLVAVATQALTVTIHEYKTAKPTDDARPK